MDNKNNNFCNNSNQDRGLGLASFSYADFVLLSSTISFALGEELNDVDLALLIVFLGMVSSDLALISTQGRIRRALGTEPAEEGVIEEEESIIGGTVVIPTGGRNSKIKKRKRIKRIKKVKKK